MSQKLKMAIFKSVMEKGYHLKLSYCQGSCHNALLKCIWGVCVCNLRASHMTRRRTQNAKKREKPRGHCLYFF